ncbi:MAG: cytidine deaminase [Lachnospiraceae bacterium]|uniref:cytidine deaminase n=1 Tax=Parablautia sp. Marseille-Q6255 TaxID=3039593 RepID=UPI0024BC115A|nr:cytidine deaminase [Parablautia sp. Marseille-Q6255]
MAEKCDMTENQGKELTQEQKRELVELALKARAFSYAPYSGFSVGAALLAKDGRIFTGCNVENASYGATNCAERTAVFKAVSEGARAFAAIAIAGGAQDASADQIASPCGICRQVLAEFCEPQEFLVLLGKDNLTWEEYTLEELLPLSFSGQDLNDRHL